MTFSILPPPAPSPVVRASSPSSSPFLDSDGDADLTLPCNRSKTSQKAILTPGEVVTEDPQWMRGHGTTTTGPPSSTTILATVAGTLHRTNKLLSIHPLRARYTPSIGDLIIGRIVSVETKRWRVDVSAPLLAHLPLSAINLPGGALRKRTATDELAIRSFFSEGDLLVAEVQSVYGDGAASLHTRSLRYGKLRNGVFLRVGGTGGGGGGVVRSKRQVWTVSAGNGGGEVDVVLGVNGYVFICKHSRGELAAGREEAKRMNVVTRMEEEEDKEGEGSVLYGDRNEEIQPETRREIARLGGVVGALVENGVRVDEEMVMAGYGVSLEMEEMGVGEDVFLGGEKGKMVVEAALKRVRG